MPHLLNVTNILKTPKWFLISFLAAILILFGLRAFTMAGLWVAEADRPGKVDVIVCLNGSERIKKTAELYHQSPLVASWRTRIDREGGMVSERH